MAEKKLMKGNEAFATSAIHAGCRYYFGYPITPQNEVPEFMSRELSKMKAEGVIDYHKENFRILKKDC